ncbi:hypothetical protein [Streptomyces sp. NPDC059176]|uniref:hypothetical protein n=1 Tax=unclassified Streptomyces TaxID=2593676 RepID=UPI0036977E59
MRTRLIAAPLVCALALTACGSSGEKAADGPAADRTTSSPAATTVTSPVTSPAPAAPAPSSARAAAGIPAEPTGPDRQKYLQALSAIDPALVTDEDKAVDAGRNQCRSLHGGGADPDRTAAQRFGNDARPVTEATGKRINSALRRTLCP